MKKLGFIGLWLCSMLGLASGQDAVLVGEGSNLHAFGGMTIFGDVQHEGYIHQDTNTTLVFVGSYWQNTITSRIEGGGTVEFLQPHPATGNSFLQTIEAGGVQSSFNSVEVNNPEHLSLFGTDMKIRALLRFTKGCIILDGNDLILGGSAPGSLQGFSHDRFVVTNGEPEDTKGFLKKEGVAGFASTFPVGVALEDYTPARLVNTGGINNYRVRVFPDVYDFATSGSLRNDKTVQRTWQIIEDFQEASQVKLSLQHNQANQGVLFTGEENYVARYIGLAPNQAGGSLSLTDFEYWDFVQTAKCTTNDEGNITQGAVQPDAFLNARSLLRDFTEYTYYTVHSCSNDSDFIIPNMFSPNGDGINDTWEIESIQFFPTRDLKVINRWGDVVFRTKTYNNDWDGTFAGDNLPAGTYFYVLDLGEDGGIKKGDVTILR